MLKLPYKDGEITPLGFVVFDDRVYFFYSSHHTDGAVFRIDVSEDGKKFTRFSNTVEIKFNDQVIHSEDCKDFKFARYEGNYYLLFKNKVDSSYIPYIARSYDLIHWETIGKVLVSKEVGVLVSDYKFNDNYILYSGSSVKRAYSKDFRSWEKFVTPILKPKKDFYGKQVVILENSVLYSNKILLFYFLRRGAKGKFYYTLKILSFGKNNPGKLVSHSQEVVWQSGEEWVRRRAVPIGIVIFKDKIISYWHSTSFGIFAIFHTSLGDMVEKRGEKRGFLLRKLHHNPIIKPIAGNDWESKATFNPAAIYEGGKVHLLYRAIGDQDVSVLGYAASNDGIHIHDRHNSPAYVPRESFEVITGYAGRRPIFTQDSLYVSGGGGYGGCEDPRVTKIEDRLYMTYVAYNGFSHPRIALTSVDLDDFLHHQFNWEAPVLISRPGEVNKNACILPEKIDGKYVIFHRVFPNILIDFVDDLEFDGESNWLKGEYAIEPRRSYWDSRKVGIGPPPIKTKDGWLTIYQGVDDRNDKSYKMGAMLLDLSNPRRVLHRTSRPILEPNERYENEGHKAGVAYPCGAVVIDNDLFVYYGGADTVVCVAHANLNEFLGHLKYQETAELYPIGSQK